LTAPGVKDAVTAILEAPARGERDLLHELLPVVYGELRQMAHRQLAHERHRTLNTTGLLHEAYLKLVDESRVPVRNRDYFFAAAARAMRQVLIDAARRRGRDKRGGGQPALDVEGLELAVDGLSAQLRDLEDALGRLASVFPRQARVVECRFFGGLSVEETAQALDLAPRTVKRDWALARAWLYRELRGGSEGR
jgi:RNA polymerase sigma factor (TIGR02999 family)